MSETKTSKTVTVNNNTQIHSRYNHPVSKPVTLNYTDSKTKQSFKDECDINNILKKFRLDEIIEAQKHSPDLYQDVSDVAEFHEAQNVIVRAKEQFEALPSYVRETFRNDPALFLEFASEPKNIDAMGEMGLAVKRVKAPKTLDDVVDHLEKALPKATGTPEPKIEPKKA